MAISWALPLEAARPISLLIFFACMMFFAFPKSFSFAQHGRPTIGMIAACLCIFSGCIVPETLVKFLDGDIILEQIGLLMFTVFLQAGGIIDWTACRIAYLTNSLNAPMLWWCASAAFSILSAIFSSDYMAILLTPLLVRFCQAKDWAPTPFVVSLATNLNVGTMLSVVGSSASGAVARCSYCKAGEVLDALSFTAQMMAPTLIMWIVNALVLYAFFRRRIGSPAATEVAELPPKEVSVAAAGPPPVQSAIRQRFVTPFTLSAATVGLLSVVLVGRAVGLHGAWVAMVMAALLLFFNFESADSVLAKVDWLLVFTCATWMVVWSAVHVAFGPLLAPFADVTSSSTAPISFTVAAMCATLIMGPSLATQTFLPALADSAKGRMALAAVTAATSNAAQIACLNNMVVTVLAGRMAAVPMMRTTWRRQDGDPQERPAEVRDELPGRAYEPSFMPFLAGLGGTLAGLLGSVPVAMVIAHADTV